MFQVSGPSKSYQEWIFDLEEFLADQGLPANAQGFEKGALVYGFTNGLSPADFVKDKVNIPKAVSVPMVVTPPVLNTSNPGRISTKTITVAICGVTTLIVAFIAVPKIIHPGAPGIKTGLFGPSQEYRNSAKKAVEAVEAIGSRTKVGVSFLKYHEELSEAQIFLDKFAREAPKNDPIVKKLEESLEHYDFAEDVWQVAIDDEMFSPKGKVVGDRLIREYTECGDYLIRYLKGDAKNSSDLTAMLTAVWNHGASAATEARNLLPK